MNETIYRGRIVTLELLDGAWEIVRHAHSVAVLAIGSNGRVLGVRQARPAVAATTWELPAGVIDRQESPLQAALRELAEEAGLAGELRPLSRGFVSPGFTDELVHLFEARELRPASGHALDEGEELQVEWRDPLEVWREVADGSLATSLVTVLGLRHALALRGVLP